MLLNASAAAILATILGFHVYQVSVCKDPKSSKCRALSIRPDNGGGMPGKLQLLAKVVGLVVIPLAIASSDVSLITVAVSTLVLCLAAGTYEMIVGCGYKKKTALCRANVTELLALGACTACIALLMVQLLGDKLKESTAL